MLVVLVMVVEMFVFQRLMNVLVFVSLGDVQPDADEHENARSTERPIETALSDCEGERGARKGGGGEIGSCTSRAKMTEHTNIKNEVCPVAEKTDSCHGEGSTHGREFRASGESEAGIYGASNETLPHGDLQRITAGDFASEVIINPQQRQAAAMRIAPSERSNLLSCGNESKTPPKG